MPLFTDEHISGNFEVDLNNYKSWLELFDADEIVGMSSNESACPFKNYFHTINPKVTDMGYYLLYFLNEKPKQVLPPIEDIIKKLDNVGDYNSKPITARVALEILKAQRPSLWETEVDSVKELINV